MSMPAPRPVERPGFAGLAAAIAALWVLPLWIVRFLPMVDHPQQLALAAILRWYGDPSRRFDQVYERVWTTPHNLFEWLTAALAGLLPIETAGKLVVSLSLVAVGLAAWGLCRRLGRPPVYALLALALTYNYAFYWGFNDNLLGYPLFLAGLLLADRRFDRPFGAGSWLLLAAITLLFYEVHLQLLLLFAGAVGWLALVRRQGWRQAALWLSSLLPGVTLAVSVLLHASLRSPVGVVSEYERRMRELPTRFGNPLSKLLDLPDLLFGAHADGSQWLLAGLLLAIVLLVARRRPAEESGGGEARRFAFLAGWVGLLYFVLPAFHGGFLIAERLAPLAVMLLVIALPVPSAPRRRLAAILIVALAVFQLGQTLAGFLRFRAESAGLEELLAATEPGENLAGLLYERGSASWRRPAVFLHAPAYYQATKGGRILFSFAELYQTPVRFRPSQSWDALLREWNEWTPERFVYPRHAGRFRYFLVRGGPEHLAAAFGPYLRDLRVRSAGRWHLVEVPER